MTTTYAQGSVAVSTVTYEGHKGQTPVLDHLGVVAAGTNPVVRTDPWTALTPNELELNRELAWSKTNLK